MLDRRKTDEDDKGGRWRTVGPKADGRSSVLVVGTTHSVYIERPVVKGNMRWSWVGKLSPRDPDSEFVERLRNGETRLFQLPSPEPSAVLAPALGLFGELRARAERAGWAVPTPLTQSTARTLVTRLFHAAERAQLPWRNPHVTGSPTGSIVLEWWKDPRDLTLYVEGKSVCFVRSWGTSIDHEMEDGEVAADRPEGLVGLWRWLEFGPDAR